MAAKAATGQVDFAGRQFKTADIPLFKRFEQDNGYATYLWPRPYGSDVAFMVNMTHPDERLRRIFQDVRFRRALSLAIDRARDQRHRLLRARGPSPVDGRIFEPLL